MSRIDNSGSKTVSIFKYALYEGCDQYKFPSKKEKKSYSLFMPCSRKYEPSEISYSQYTCVINIWVELRNGGQKCMKISYKDLSYRFNKNDINGYNNNQNNRKNHNNSNDNNINHNADIESINKTDENKSDTKALVLTSCLKYRKF